MKILKFIGTISIIVLLALILLQRTLFMLLGLKTFKTRNPNPIEKGSSIIWSYSDLSSRKGITRIKFYDIWV